MNEFTKTIVEWYEENKRELPWRESADPYLIWISEIILQQTRVAQGYDYFLRFIKRFPDVQTLAAADEDEVMKYWQGLGYYSRDVRALNVGGGTRRQLSVRLLTVCLMRWWMVMCIGCFHVISV